MKVVSPSARHRPPERLCWSSKWLSGLSFPSDATLIGAAVLGELHHLCAKEAFLSKSWLIMASSSAACSDLASVTLILGAATLFVSLFVSRAGQCSGESGSLATQIILSRT